MIINTLGTLLTASGHGDALAAPAPRERAEAITVPSEKAILLESFGSSPTETGIHVNEHSAMKYLVVYACINIISEDLATLPFDVFEELEDGKQLFRGHYIQEILRYPNPEMTGVSFWQTTTAHILGWGNSYALCEWSGAGRLKALWPLPPDLVKVDRDKAGRLVYGFGKDAIPASDILHIPGLGFNGVLGYSPLAVAREAIGLGMAPEKFAAKFYANNAQPGMVLSTDQVLNPETRQEIRQSWDAIHKGLKGAYTTGVLEGGLKPITPSISQTDAQFLETRNFQVLEICRLYRMPPHMVADLSRANFSNIEQSDIGYTKYTLRPWAKRIEAAVRRRLFGPGRYFAEFNLEGLLRGDTATRYEAYKSAIDAGWMARDEARRRENLRPRGGNADVLTVQSQNVPLDSIGTDTTDTGDIAA